MHSTPQWPPETLENPPWTKVVFAVSGPEANALAVDLGINQAGWKTSTAGLIAAFLENAGSATSEYRHIIPRAAIDFVQIRPVVTSKSLLAAAATEGPARASSDGLLNLVEGLFELLGSRRFNEVELLLQSANPAELAPEISVGILRVTSNYAHSLKPWSAFLERTRGELTKRGLPTDAILVGLGAAETPA